MTWSPSGCRSGWCAGRSISAIPTVATQIVATLADLAGRYRCDAGLLIVDTTSRALCGGDENSPKDMGALIANLGRIQGSVEIHLLLTHHQPAEKERMRGHGALLGAVDTTVHITKTTAGRFAEVVKSSDHEEGQRVAFFLNSVTVDTDEQGDPITAPVVIEAMAGVAPKKKASLPNAAKVAINALEEAIAELGVVPPASNHIPPATRAVTADQWRDYAYRRGISTSDKPRAKQAAFERAVKESSSRQGHRNLGTTCLARVRDQSWRTKRTLLKECVRLVRQRDLPKCALCALCAPETAPVSEEVQSQ